MSVAVVVPAASASDCVLFLGDSFSMGAFGRSFDSNLRGNGLKVYTYVAGGSSPYYWLSSYESIPSSIGFWKKTPTTDQRLGYIRAVPKIEPLMEACEPDYVVVQTGVNLYATLRSKRRPKDQNVAEVRHLIDEMCKVIHSRGARSYWVLPPTSHEDRYPSNLQGELEALMVSVVKKYNGGVFKSRSCTRFTDPYPATDGIHYGPEESTQWAEQTASAFKAFSDVDPSLLTSNQPPRAKPVEVPGIGNAPSPDAPSGPAAYKSTHPEPPAPPEPLPKADTTKAADKPAQKEGAETKVAAADMPPEKKAAEDAPASDAPGDAPPKTVGAEVKLDLGPDAEFEVKLRLVAKSKVENLSEVTYSNALGVFEYEVLESINGGYPHKRIRIAHGIVLNRKATRANSREIGHTMSMTVVPLSRYPSLQRWQTVDDLRANFEMPLFVPKL